MSQTTTEIIQDGRKPDEPEGPIIKALEAIRNDFFESNKEVITILRQQTPVKVSHVFVVDDHGCIGAGLDTPDPHTLYECPMSAEATIHRLTVWCAEYSPSNPLNSGQILCTGSTAGEIIFYLPMEPDQTQIAPMQPILEGSQSAPHLNGGERMLLVGDQLPPKAHIRIDLQLLLNMGASQYTPRSNAPTNLNTIQDTDIS